CAAHAVDRDLDGLKARDGQFDDFNVYAWKIHVPNRSCDFERRVDGFAAVRLKRREQKFFHLTLPRKGFDSRTWQLSRAPKGHRSRAPGSPLAERGARGSRRS